MKGLLSVVSLAVIASVNARTWTVKNNCAFTVWPAIFTDLNVGTAVPDQATGWEAPAGSSVSFTVPDNWKAGRIWGRTDCDFSTNPGPNSCVTGGCNGGLECASAGGTGVPPASVAEWTLQGDQNLDYYDVSLVDGFNLPMEVTNNVGCNVASCPADLNPDCPSELVLTGPNGNAGCKSACFANLDGNQADSGNCCSGSHSTPDTCPASGVQFYDYFKSGCPNSYVYAYDESSGTALWTCDSSLNADYTLTFCP
ncbi:thaumatin-like protein [Dendrothele bispora CBS 962.96]|uniref:Thaumatin-like protein n=1 Tax=Dendrothele bispora (strain CBS 962.96) TaxID=1314807 RepID=A0A4S8L897_DENBC|nr:thaumatin-like protein [Dendrothele bispora CBS 962.96]